MSDRSDIDAPDATTARIVTGTVRLINRYGIAALTVPAICAESGVDSAAFGRRFGSPNDVLVEIVRTMLAAYGTAIDSALTDRLPLGESIRLTQQNFLDVIVAHRDRQAALVAIRLAAVDDPRLGMPAGATRSLHDELTTNCELWLAETARVHAIRWALPARLLATFVCASLTGVVTDLLERGDLAASRAVVDVIAADLTAHALPTVAAGR